MSELKMISPLLDGMTVEKEGPNFDGRKYYTLRDRSSGEQLMLKVLSVPSSDSHVRALILSGAYPDEAAVNEYYRRYTEDIRRELKLGKELTATGYFAGALDFQVVPKEPEVGFDIYILLKRHIPLSYLLSENAITGLRAINLGIDICDALIGCREAGLLFTNLTPNSIYLTPGGKFLLGDLGLVDLEDLEYSSVPEEYIGAYSAPELSDINESPNATIDLYSLGMVLFRIYNGNHGPYEDENTGETMADKLRLSGKPLPTPIYADYELAGIIQKACAFNKEDRFQSPEEMKQALVLYMQRNEVADQLIVPPIVVNFMPAADLPEEEDDEEPIRMTNEDSLDETFRRSFSPDLSGAGTDSDIDPALAATEEADEEDAPVPVPVEESFPSPAQAEETKPAPDAASAEETPAEEAPAIEQELDEALALSAQEEPVQENPDQLDIDSFLASLSDMIDTGAPVEDVPEEPAEESNSTVSGGEEQKNGNEGFRLHFEKPTAVLQDYVDTCDNEDTSVSDTQEKKRPTTVPLLIILGLLLAIGAVIFFLVSWLYVEASTLNVTSLTTDELVIQLVTDDPMDRFTVSCTDSNGNRYSGSLVADQYRFTGLSESTTYTITVEASGVHKLNDASVTSHTVTTPEATHISDLTASRGDQDGDLLLTFLHDGPAPDSWKLSYSNTDGSISDSITFEGNACLVQGLTVGQTYTFTLENTEGIYIKDQYTLEYELLPIVQVQELTVSQITGQALIVSWSCGENAPDQWLVTCEAEGTDPTEIAVSDTLCEITLPDLSRDYTISVTAKGMDEPATLVLPADPIIVEDLTATVDENGIVTVSWQTPAGTPEDGWYLSYNTHGSLHSDYILGGENAPISGNSVELPYLIPDTQYHFTLNLTAADASRQLFGTTSIDFTTPEAVAFDEFGIQPAAPIDNSEGYISLWPIPDFEDWIYADLRGRKSSFGPDEQIVVCVELNFQTWSDQELYLTYAVRDTEGNIINDVSSEVVWDDMWYRRRHASAIPMPTDEDGVNIPGEYTLELYLDGKLFAFIDFTIE